MTTSLMGLGAKLDRELSIGNFTIILLNNPGGFTNTELDVAKWLQFEPVQSSGGYQPQVWSYTAGTWAQDLVDGGIKTPDASCQFTASGVGYPFTHVGLYQGRSTTSAKTVEAINLSNNQITVTAHGLVNGDRAFLTSTGVRPSISSGEMAIQNYWVNRIDNNTLQLATNSGLSSIVDFTTSGSGTISLRYSNGVLWQYDSASGTVNPGAPKNVTYVYRKVN